MIRVRNPRTGEVDYEFETADPAPACERVRALQPEWEASGVDARCEAMRAWRDRISASRAHLVSTLEADTGRRIESEMEVDAVLRSIDRWCATAPSLLAVQESRPSAIPAVHVTQGMRPYQLCGVISPWNFPLLLSLIDAIPALVAGCAVVVKPSEITPRFVEALAPTIAALPIAFVMGDGETGAALVDLADVVCFTGSVATGRRVAEHAARRFVPAFLELGGKDPAIVLRSADVDRATSAVLWGATANAGQSCQSIERVYVDRTILTAFTGMLIDKALALRLVPEGGEIGPVVAHRQIAIITDHLADAVARGARVECGGSIETIGGGSYLRPTVLTGADHSMKVMTEETFAPILPVMAFDTVDEAVALANDSIYGLSAAVFAGTVAEALAIAPRLDAGAISVNDAALTALVHDGEKNSFRLSGLGGSRMGPAALHRFGRRQAYLISGGGGPDPWWYASLSQR